MIDHALQKKRRSPQALVENRHCFSAPGAELSIYDTFEQARRVRLQSDQLLFCGMVTGKKVMHVDEDNYHQTFVPRESFVLAPNQRVEIDFPEAQFNKPTTCLAVEISKEKINRVAEHLNQHDPMPTMLGQWQYSQNLVHTRHNAETQALLNRIVRIFTENDPDRDYLSDLAVSELTVRLLRHQAREMMMTFSQTEPDHNGLNHAVAYISSHLTQPLDIDQLCRLACMSRTKFYTRFKQLMGCSPAVFQSQLRMKKAAEMISQGRAITYTAFELGFSNVSHFSRCFKQFFGHCPRQHQKSGMNPIN